LREFIDFGKKFDTEEKARESVFEFLQNNIFEIGNRDPEKCAHPFKIIWIRKIKNSEYLITSCRDCGKLFQIKLKRKIAV
jgi:hypothetical protein